MGALKDIYSKSFYYHFCEVAEEVIPNFDKKKFSKLIFDSEWERKELKERMRHTSYVLHEFMPDKFPKAVQYIEKMITKIRQKKFTESSLEFMFFPDYIETYGIDDFEISVKAMEFITQFTSCEFAVRPFILRYSNKMIEKMLEWSKHENHHVRRLASEGSRPRLPWAMALPDLKKNPKSILPILHNLKKDSSEYVRRSVANSLNDIAKDHPDIVIEIAKKWKGKHKDTDALLKHACRTLLKAGDVETLKLFDLAPNPKITTSNFKIHTSKVSIGNHLEFSFSIQNNDKVINITRIEYGIYYLRQNGQHSKKVFKISERSLQVKEKIEIARKQSFKIITTRQFYYGTQKLSLIINGVEKEVLEFELIE